MSMKCKTHINRNVRIYICVWRVNMNLGIKHFLTCLHTNNELINNIALKFIISHLWFIQPYYSYCASQDHGLMSLNNINRNNITVLRLIHFFWQRLLSLRVRPLWNAGTLQDFRPRGSSAPDNVIKVSHFWGNLYEKEKISSSSITLQILDWFITIIEKLIL